MKVFGWVVLALLIALTVGRAIAVIKIKDVAKAREMFETLGNVRATVALIFIFAFTVVPFKQGLTHLGLPDLAARPLTVLCPLILAWLLLALFAAEKELGFGGSAVLFVFVMTGMGFYLWVAGGWDLVDRFFGAPN